MSDRTWVLSIVDEINFFLARSDSETHGEHVQEVRNVISDQHSFARMGSQMAIYMDATLDDGTHDIIATVRNRESTEKKTADDRGILFINNTVLSDRRQITFIHSPEGK